MKRLKINYKNTFEAIFKIALLYILYLIATGLRYERVEGTYMFDKWDRVVILDLPHRYAKETKIPFWIKTRSYFGEQRIMYEYGGKKYFIPESKVKKFLELRPYAKRIGMEW